MEQHPSGKKTNQEVCVAIGKPDFKKRGKSKGRQQHRDASDA